MPEEEGEDPLRQLREALNSDPDSPSHHYEMGFLLWKRGEEEGSKELMEKAVEHFVTSAKLNPSNGAAFRYLGHYYSRVSVDEQRASKCYLRAVNVNPEDSESGESLCDLLDGGGKESLEIAVCRDTSEKSPKAFWAFRRLGYLLVQQKKWSEAVQSLQHAIRGYPTCADLWEALGLAYQRLGMFTAAIKSYGRAVELEDSKILALVESGNIHLMLGSSRQGIEQFRRALEISPNNVSARFGLASALLGLSKECVNFGAFSWASSLLEEASEVTKGSTCLVGNCSSLWKLLGDIQIAYAKCFPWVEEQKDTITDLEKFETSIHHWKKSRVFSANRANRAYQRALHLTPWQANVYTDIAHSLDFIASIEERNTPYMDVWQLPEKMALGSLILEGENSGFWVAFGCLSHNNALKQHALIRGLHLDISLSVAWAYLGKFYRRSGNLELAKQAFDRARSIDPSLALPWAGMSVGSARESLSDEAYESCLRAVQMLPLPEFQIGLGKLAALSGHLLSPQVFGAIQQAVQRAPYYPESHNLKGLVCEARSDYCSAIAAYRNAQYALNFFCKSAPKSQVADISLNLARSLCQAGHASDAEQVCEELKREGFLDNIGQQLYVIALWQQGKKESFLTEAAYLARNIPEMDRSCGAAALGLVCRLVYCSLGQDHATRTILKSPRDLLQNAKMSFVVAALCALDSSCPLHSLLSCDLQSFLSDEAAEMHYVTAVSKMLANQSHVNMGIKFAQHHLRKALHMYPDSGLMRKQLSSLLLCSKDWMASHIATRCVSTAGRHSVMKASNSGYEILGAATVACYGNCMGKHKLSFPTCKSQFVPVGKRIHQLQKWFREEPWNCKARYLLILSVLQKAREEKFPKHLCVSLKRLVSSALSDDVYLVENQVYVYQKFQLLLCASEIHLQSGDYLACISQAIEASRVPLYNDGRFFAHLQLCRGYAIIEDWQNLRNEYMKCIQHGTFYEIGWISLKLIESRYTLLTNVCSIDSNLETCLKENEESQHMWAAVFDLVCCQSFLWNRDFLHAEAALAHACSMERVDSCLLLCHGAVCMELARQQGGSHFLLLAIDSLTKAQGSSPIPLPIVSALLAQAVGSLGAKDQWKKNLQSEWFSWPAEMRPAELYFQMHLLTRRSNVGSKRYSGVESSQSPERWVLESIHINPSSLRYWKVLQKLMES